MRNPCGRRVVDGYCGYERMKGKQRCVWHWLMSQPADIQAQYAKQREAASIPTGMHSARVPAAQWPEGERWCAGCQSFVPFFYCSGSRCKACASTAAHAQRVEKVYGITGDEYDELLRRQGGRCFICQRKPGKKRLAVDHDHKTGAVRGLLCANNEHGCNRAIVANLEAAHDGGLAAARRALLYLWVPPYERMRTGSRITWKDFLQQELERLEEPVGYDGQGAPLYEHQLPPF